MFKISKILGINNNSTYSLKNLFQISNFNFASRGKSLQTYVKSNDKKEKEPSKQQSRQTNDDEDEQNDSEYNATAEEHKENVFKQTLDFFLDRNEYTWDDYKAQVFVK